MEEFKSIPNYVGYYEISNKGRVKSLAGEKCKIDKVLKEEVRISNTTNYRRVTLSKAGKTDRFSVHRLVALAFIDNPEDKPMVNHIDNNGENNNVENLEWCTHSENMVHAQKQGRLFNSQQKGGLVSGQSVRKKKVAQMEELIGTTVNSWLVEGYNLPSIENNLKYTVECICLPCGSNHTVEVSRLLANKPKMCPTCSRNNINDAKDQKLIHSMKNTVYDNWKLTGVYETVRTPTKNKPVKIIFLEAKCKNCFNTTALKLDRIRLGHINRCIVCDTRNNILHG